MFTAQVEDENIDYVIPEEGAVKWKDNLCITADAAADPQRLEMAYQWIDFLNRSEIAAMNTDFVWYASPTLPQRSLSTQKSLDMKLFILLKKYLRDCTGWKMSVRQQSYILGFGQKLVLNKVKAA